MGRERGSSGTHILKDFELQRRGIQVIEFPCKGMAHVREGCLTDGCSMLLPCVSSGLTSHPEDPHSFQTIFGCCLVVQLTSQALPTP